MVRSGERLRRKAAPDWKWLRRVRVLAEGPSSRGSAEAEDAGAERGESKRLATARYIDIVLRSYPCCDFLL